MILNSEIPEKQKLAPLKTSVVIIVAVKLLNYEIITIGCLKFRTTFVV